MVIIQTAESVRTNWLDLHVFHPNDSVFISAPQICNIMNTAADETFQFQVKKKVKLRWKKKKKKNSPGISTKTAITQYHMFLLVCSDAAERGARRQRVDHQKCSVAANRQQKRRDSRCGHFLQQKRRKAFWWSGRAAHGGRVCSTIQTVHSMTPTAFEIRIYDATHVGVMWLREVYQAFNFGPCSIPIPWFSGFDSVPGLVSFEHGHLRQDEQAGESERHRSRHGALPRQVSRWWDSEYPGQYCVLVVWNKEFFQLKLGISIGLPLGNRTMFHTLFSNVWRFIMWEVYLPITTSALVHVIWWLIISVFLIFPRTPERSTAVNLETVKKKTSYKFW